jgi:hypothetical protein
LTSGNTGKAIVLNVKGLPPGENPASFIQENSRSFLVGTKTSSAPAVGNVYRVQIQQDLSWKASKLNTTAIGFNISDMVSPGTFVMAIAQTNGKDFLIPAPLPSGHKVTVYTQWYVVAPKANSLMAVLSDARKLKTF